MRPVLVAGLGVAGLTVIVVGTFLPWLRAGRGLHNSYQTDGTMQRLLHLHGLSAHALDAWPFIGVLCAGVVAVYALGARRTAAGLATLTALIAGAVAVGALVVHSSTFARPATLGPRVTVLGVIITLVAGTLCLFARDEIGMKTRGNS
jgi:hypothetical protein